MVETTSRSESPAGPTSLFFTSASICWLIVCSSACALDPKPMIDCESLTFSSAMRRRISWAFSGGAEARGVTAGAGSGRSGAVTSASRGRASAASRRLLSVI